jgi:lysophospholipase L1-like esterase
MRGVFALILLCLCATTPVSEAASSKSAPWGWVTAWHAPAFSSADARAWKFEHDYSGHTIRHTIRIGTGAAALRVKFGNETGGSALRIVAASLIVRRQGKIAPAAPMRLTFSGRSAFTIPAGAPAYTDQVIVDVERFDEIDVSVQFAGADPVLLSGHLAQVVDAPGAWVMSVDPPTGAQITGPSPVESIEVLPQRPQRVFVAIGDSITEGARSSIGRHRSWPEQFAERAAREGRHNGWVVVNSGISGNRILNDSAGPGLLARFDRDALDLCGGASVLVLEGVNDIFRGTALNSAVGDRIAARDVIGAYRQLIARAHGRRWRIFGATIIPFQGPDRNYSEGEKIRQEINDWIRHSGSFDGYVDFDLAVRDPDDHERMAARYDSGDHVHPGDDGYRRMALAVPLTVLSGNSSGVSCGPED